MSEPQEVMAAPVEVNGARQPVQKVIAHLESLGNGASYTACMLRESYIAQRECLQWMHSLGSREQVTLAEMDAVLIRWLHACYCYISSVPGLGSASTPLVPIVALAGLLRPFIGVEDNRLLVGLPSNAEATADSLSELVRVVGAALVCYHDYLNVPALPDRALASDDSALLFSTMAIRSCQNELGMEALKEQIAAAAAVDITPPGSAPALPAAYELPEHAR